MNTLRLIDKILLTAVVLLALGQGYMIFSRAAGQSVTSSSANISDIPASTPTLPSAPLPNTVLTPISGAVASISGDAITLQSTLPGGQTSTTKLSVTSDTVIVKQGAPKDTATQDKDMQAFHDYSNKLAEDPTKNHAALAALMAPSPFIETPITLQDIKPGNTITAFVAQSPTGATAVRIIVLSKPQ